jgi:hypothetical protein
MLFVTMLYELDRSLWGSKWQRSFQHYLKHFLDLVKSLDSEIELLVFSDNDKVNYICSHFPQVTYVHYDRYWFELSAQRHRIRSAISNRYNLWSSPEFTQGEYVYLQLCKFEAVRLALSLRDTEYIAWIDGGYRWPPQKWSRIIKQCKQDKIYGLQCAQECDNEWLILNSPTQHVQGSFWGSHRDTMKKLVEKSLVTVYQLLDRGKIGNDQQILSLVHLQSPNLFNLRKSYTIHWMTGLSTSNTGTLSKQLSLSTDRIEYNYVIVIFFMLYLFIRGQLCLQEYIRKLEHRQLDIYYKCMHTE